MARLVGKDGYVTVDGSTLEHLVAWSANQQPQYTTHYGATDSTPSVNAVTARWSGSFEVEADAGSTVQAALRSANPVSCTLVLYEASGEGWSIPAFVTQGISVQRSGKVVRTYAFIDRGGVTAI